MKKIRRINSFVLVLSLTYVILNYTIGQIPILKQLYFIKPILIKEVVFLGISIFTTLYFFNWKTNEEENDSHPVGNTPGSLHCRSNPPP